jgi:hypothetical protein
VRAVKLAGLGEALLREPPHRADLSDPHPKRFLKSAAPDGTQTMVVEMLYKRLQNAF